MHVAGHVDKWCKDACDSRKFSELDYERTLLILVIKTFIITFFLAFPMPVCHVRKILMYM